MVKISDLRAREVVNIVDGRRLGLIKDIDIDLEEGRITAIILPGGGGGAGKFLGFFGKEEEIIVPWDKIKKIGMDVILVEVTSFTDPRHGLNGFNGF
jgi:YlmC/YmxH family sporulation protein